MAEADRRARFSIPRAGARALVPALGDSAQFTRSATSWFAAAAAMRSGRALIAAGKGRSSISRLLDIDNYGRERRAAIALTSAAVLTVHTYPQCMRAAVRQRRARISPSPASRCF